MLKKEKAIPELAQLTWEVDKIRSPVEVVITFLFWLAVKQKQTNHMNPQRPLAMTSTNTSTFLIYSGTIHVYMLYIYSQRILTTVDGIKIFIWHYSYNNNNIIINNYALSNTTYIHFYSTFFFTKLVLHTFTFLFNSQQIFSTNKPLLYYHLNATTDNWTNWWEKGH